MRIFIALFQLIGGIIGLIIFGSAIVSGNILMIVGIPFFGLSVIAGVFLLRNKKYGKLLSTINLSLQLLRIKGLGVQYLFYGGIAIYLNYFSGAFGPSFKIGGQLIFGLTSVTTTLIAINLFAAGLLIALRINKKIK